MRRIAIYVTIAAMFFSSCINELELGTKTDLVLEYSIEGLDTKATEPGDNELNENKIDELDVFFYRSGINDAQIYKHFTLSGENTLKIHLSKSDLDKLGYTTGSQTSFNLFVIANRPNDVSVNGTESDTELKDKEVRTAKDFNEIQDNFLMTGYATATGGSGTSGFTASVALRRTACKFGIEITAETNYSGLIGTTDGTWAPVPDAATVKFFGASKTGKLGGAPIRSSQVDYETEHSLPAAYYSYPTSPLPENKPYFIIKLPWYNGEVTENTFYKVICDYEAFEANTFYKLSVNITMVGSSSEPEPIRVSPEALNFETAPWQTGRTEGKEYQTEAVIKDARYLVVYNNVYTMENINSIEIPFTSSHPCDVTVTSAKWTDFSAIGGTVSRNLSDSEYLGNKTFTAVINSEGDRFTLTHTLNNDFENTTTFDVSPIVFTVTLKHTDSDRDIKTFTITQNPAIILDIIENQNSNGSPFGYRFLNGIQNGFNDNSNNTYEKNLGGLQWPNGQTPNMYVVRISALSPGSKYVLGDPRSLDVDNLTWTEVTQQTGRDIVTDAAGRSLTNYYPTRDDGTADNVIAPFFMTSSGWSRGSSGTKYQYIKNRAATYQELGYPAGRWRLLTKAEAMVLARLNRAGKIPMLFSPSFPYFVAGDYIITPENSEPKFGGSTTVKKADQTDQKGSARLAYDRWYWDETDYPRITNTTRMGRYTYGDLPRQ